MFVCEIKSTCAFQDPRKLGQMFLPKGHLNILPVGTVNIFLIKTEDKKAIHIKALPKHSHIPDFVGR